MIAKHFLSKVFMNVFIKQSVSIYIHINTYIYILFVLVLAQIPVVSSGIVAPAPTKNQQARFFGRSSFAEMH